MNLESQTDMEKPPANPGHADLISARKLSKNVLLNLFAEGVPLLVSLFCIPILVHRLGTEQFGILTLAWAIIGYFGIFDMGLGRALSKIVAERLGHQDYESIPVLFWTGLLMMGVLGLIAAAVLGGGASYAVRHILSVSSYLQHETVIILYLLAATVPLVILTSGMTGVLTAYQRFDLITKVRIPIGAWMFVGPVIAVFIFHTLISVVVMAVLGRCVMWFSIGLLCWKNVPGLGGPIFRRHEVKPLVSFGGWLTVSNIVSPVMEYMDRFFIAAVVGLSAVAFYTTPFMAAIKVQILPNILLAVLFPAMATALSYDRLRARKMFTMASISTFLVVFPIALIVIAFGKYGLEFWLGKDFADHSTLPLQILMVGILVNSLALIPYSFIQADGRPDITAKLHLIELPLYLAFLWYALHGWGITGAAIAWTSRVTLDWLMLLVISTARMKSRASLRLIIVVALLLVCFYFVAKPESATTAGVLSAVTVVVFIVFALLFLANHDERAKIRRFVRGMARGKLAPDARIQ